MRTIADKWVVFEAANLTQNTPENMRLMLKHCFYTGAFSFMQLQSEVGQSNKAQKLSDEAGQQIFMGIYEELTDFLNIRIV